MKQKINCLVSIFLAMLLMGCDLDSDSNVKNNSIEIEDDISSGQVVVESASVVSLGENLIVEVNIQDFPMSEGGGITVEYDPAILQLRSIAVNKEAWDYQTKKGSLNSVEGRINDIMVSSFQGVSGNENIVEIEFYTKNSGDTEVAVIASEVNPFSGGGVEIKPIFTGKTVTIN